MFYLRYKVNHNTTKGTHTWTHNRTLEIACTMFTFMSSGLISVSMGFVGPLFISYHSYLIPCFYGFWYVSTVIIWVDKSEKEREEMMDFLSIIVPILWACNVNSRGGVYYIYIYIILIASSKLITAEVENQITLTIG